MKFKKLLVCTAVLVSILTSTVFGAQTEIQNDSLYMVYEEPFVTNEYTTLGNIVIPKPDIYFYTDLGSTTRVFWGNNYYSFLSLPYDTTVNWSSSKAGLIKDVEINAMQTQAFKRYDDLGTDKIKKSASGIRNEVWITTFNENVTGTVTLRQTYNGTTYTTNVHLLMSTKPVTGITLPGNINTWR